jgi:hypothetical protein
MWIVNLNIYFFMCIVSFVRYGNGVVMTFNRDENPARPFSNPAFDKYHHILCPLDLKAGGTWIGASVHDIMCLQNGAFKRHIRNLPYGQSRGALLMNLLKGKGIEETFRSLDTVKTEPFTLCILNRRSLILQIFRYDGQVLHRQENTLEYPFIICSSTLYNEDLALKISDDFMDLMVKNPETILDFHLEHRIGGKKNRKMEIPATTSITQFVPGTSSENCLFMNMISGEQIIRELPV